MSDFLARKTEESYIIWFEKSNQWVKMDEPQWFIFLLYDAGVSRDIAVDRVMQQLGIEDHLAIHLVNNLYDSILILKDQGFDDEPLDEKNNLKQAELFNDLFTHYYKSGSKTFRVGYGDDTIRSYFHHALKYLETDIPADDSGFPDYRIIRAEDGFWLLTGKNKSQKVGEMPQVKQLFFVELSKYLHSRDSWMTILHASALKINGKLFMLTSATGSGKSTMAARLISKGNDFFSDDFVPVDFEGKAYPFPPAVCLKKNSLPVLHNENIEPSYQYGETGYMMPNKSFSEIEPSMIDAVIFIRYERSANLQFCEVTPGDAIIEFMQESWVCSTRDEVETFLGWLLNMKFYRLIYNDGQQAAEALLEFTPES